MGFDLIDVLFLSRANLPGGFEYELETYCHSYINFSITFQMKHTNTISVKGEGKCCIVNL